MGPGGDKRQARLHKVKPWHAYIMRSLSVQSNGNSVGKSEVGGGFASIVNQNMFS